MRLPSRWTSWGLAFAGLVCIIANACENSPLRPWTEDISLVQAPILRIPSEALKASGQASVLFDAAAPSTVQRAWGSPHFVLLWRTVYRPVGRWNPGSWELRSLGSVPLDIKVDVSGRAATLKRVTRAPSGYSIQDADVGRAFDAAPGSSVRIDVRSTDPGALPYGELIVVRDWDGPAKSPYAGHSWEETIASTFVTWLGIGLGLTGLLGCLYHLSRLADEPPVLGR